MSDPLFKRIYIGAVEVKNRLYMPAMHLNMCKNFLVTEQLLEFYRERAKGGVGLISVGYATVDEFSGTPTNIKNQMTNISRKQCGQYGCKKLTCSTSDNMNSSSS